MTPEEFARHIRRNLTESFEVPLAITPVRVTLLPSGVLSVGVQVSTYPRENESEPIFGYTVEFDPEKFDRLRESPGAGMVVSSFVQAVIANAVADAVVRLGAAVEAAENGDRGEKSPGDETNDGSVGGD